MATPRDTVAGAARVIALRIAQELDPELTSSERLAGYRDDPVRFAVEVLGIEPWSAQVRILRAFLKHRRVSVVSGHKLGKSTALAILAIWFYCVFPSARVVIMASTDRQVNGIIWREIRRLIAGARMPIPGAADIKQRADSGLTDPSDLSEIRGYTAKEAEAVAGTSGAYVLYLVDEASGVAQQIFEAIKGNLAGGSAWVFLISNPTRAEGEFYDSQHGKATTEAEPMPGRYCALRFSSRESPNITEEWRNLHEWRGGVWAPRADPIPGLAVQEWIDSMIADYGEDDPQIKIRIDGLFCVAEDAKIFPAGLLVEAQDRWEDTPAEGRLYIGLDPAGDGDGGDKTRIATRRGLKVIELRGRSGMSDEAILAELRDMITVAGYRVGRELPPVVNVESEGAAGWKVYRYLKEIADRTGEFAITRIRTSDKAPRHPDLYDTLRDEMHEVARQWLRSGGAIPTHIELYAELHAVEFTSRIKGGQLKATPKRDLRKMLGHSPDSADAVIMACWEPLSARREESDWKADAPRVPAAVQHDTRDMVGPGKTFDPWGALGAWRPR